MFGSIEDRIEEMMLRRDIEIEKEERNRCNDCEGEDCACCSIFIDRNKRHVEINSNL